MAIRMVEHRPVSKAELIEIINKNFPDDEGYNQPHQIAEITTTKLGDRTFNQSVLFGKVLKL